MFTRVGPAETIGAQHDVVLARQECPDLVRKSPDVIRSRDDGPLALAQAVGHPGNFRFLLRVQTVPAGALHAIAAQLAETGRTPDIGDHAEILFKNIGCRDRLAQDGTGTQHLDFFRSLGALLEQVQALPDSLLESELFGYRRGAFSGARREGKDGLFTQAHIGTIFLDEIGETTQTFQTTLLRVIQEMEVRPLGSDKVIPIDVRIIAATNKTLEQEVQAGNFRSDLFYRLNILRLNIPPLRFRKEDIPRLSHHFIQQNAAKLGKVISISQNAMTVLSEYRWPGNIRELQNIIERLFVTCDQKIDQELVLDAVGAFPKNTSKSPETIDGMKLSHIHEVLQQCQNNKTRAAKKLGISRTTLWRELNRTTD